MAQGGFEGVTGGLAASMKTMTVLKPETKAKILGMSPWILAKVGRIITAMQGSDKSFTEDEIDIVVNALYVSQSDENLKAAFDMFDGKLNGSVEGRLKEADFRVVLPLVGENVEEDKIDALFKEVDEDQSGNIELDEFKTLMKAMNPHQDGNQAKEAAGNVMSGFTSITSSLTSGLGDSFTTMTVLSAPTKAKLMTASPLLVTKIGRIIKNMQASEHKFTDLEVDMTVNALYLSGKTEDFQKAFDMFDEKLNSGTKQGFLTATAFRSVLPLVGEDKTDEELDTLFKETDTDGSGQIEFAEFQAMMLSMNPDKK